MARDRLVSPFMPGILALLLFIVAGCGPETAVLTPPTSPPAAPSWTPTLTGTPSPTALPTTTTIPATATPASSPTATPTPPPLDYLAAILADELHHFPGLSSYVVVDLATRDAIEHNADLAIAGMSLLKLPILINAYRVLDQPPNVEEMKLITQTTALSSNYAANLLLETIARQPNPFIGADIVTESMRDLGLYNTFMAVPYDRNPLPNRPQTYLTPANQRTDISTRPDIHRQTTAADLAQLLVMLYECAESDRGPLRDAYSETLTQAECKQIMSALTLNELVKLLEAGLPPATTIAHKLGYIDDTYGDAGIIFSPGGDYVLVLALYTPDWLEWSVAAPLFRSISQRVYAHFNDPGIYSAATPANPPPVPATAAPPPTPDWPRAIVSGTQGIGLTLRESPGGTEIGVLPEGTVLFLLPDPTRNVNNLAWRHVYTPDGQEGWVGEDYLTLPEK